MPILGKRVNSHIIYEDKTRGSTKGYLPECAAHCWSHSLEFLSTKYKQWVTSLVAYPEVIVMVFIIWELLA